MTRDEQMAGIEGSPKQKSEVIAGKSSLGGRLSKTNYPGFQVNKEQEQAAKAIVEEALKPRKQMYEPWKSSHAPEFYDGINSVKQDH